MNEPAFPTPQGSAYTNDGMSLRDYFAAKAMAAFIVGNHQLAAQLLDDATLTEERQEAILNLTLSTPTRAYDMADAMLQQREVK